VAVEVQAAVAKATAKAASVVRAAKAAKGLRRSPRMTAKKMWTNHWLRHFLLARGRRESSRHVRSNLLSCKKSARPWISLLAEILEVR
jgi:hypothetical protein